MQRRKNRRAIQHLLDIRGSKSNFNTDNHHIINGHLVHNDEGKVIYIKTERDLPNVDRVNRKEVLLVSYTADEKVRIEGLRLKKFENRINEIINKMGLNVFPSQKAMELFVSIGDMERTAAMIISTPGSGKTMTTIKFITHMLRLMIQQKYKQRRIVFITYTYIVFEQQLRMSIETGYTPMSYILNNDGASSGIPISAQQSNMDFDSTGYKRLASRILNVHDMKNFEAYIVDNSNVDPIEMIRNAESEGLVTINWPEVHKFRDTFIITDEAHKTQNYTYVNKIGIILLLIKKFTNCFLIYISASVITGNINELKYVQYLILDKYLPYNQCIGPDGNIISDWREKIVPLFKGYVYFSGVSDSSYTPSHEYIEYGPRVISELKKKDVGDDYKFYALEMTDQMKRYVMNTKTAEHYGSYLFNVDLDGKPVLSYPNGIKHLVNNPKLLPTLHAKIGLPIGDVSDSSVSLSGPMLRIQNISQCSRMMKEVLDNLFVRGMGERVSPLLVSKYDSHEKMNKELAHLRDLGTITDEGKILIYTFEVVFPGTPFVIDALVANGCVRYGGMPAQDSICLRCLRYRSQHPKKKVATVDYYYDKPADCMMFTPIFVMELHAYITTINALLSVFNSSKE